MAKTYKCIKEFFVSRYDENCFARDELMLVANGSVWMVDDNPGSYIGGEVTLLGDDGWLEITKERLEHHFEEVAGDGKQSIHKSTRRKRAASTSPMARTSQG